MYNMNIPLDAVIRDVTYPNIVRDRYTVSIYGDIYDKKKKRYVRKEVSKKDYWYVRLKSITGKRQQVFIHRLVAHEFIPNPLNKETVNHIRGGKIGKENNTIFNLHWATHQEQMDHAFSTGLFNNKMRTKIGENACNVKYPDNFIIEIYDIKNRGYRTSEVAKKIIDLHPEMNLDYKKFRAYLYNLFRENSRIVHVV